MCVNPRHLYDGTHAENMADVSRRRRWPSRSGENNPRNKLTVEQIREIRRRLLDGETQQKLSDEFGIAQQTVSAIKTRKTWPAC